MIWRKFLTLPGPNSDPSVLQPAASRDTDCSIAAITQVFNETAVRPYLHTLLPNDIHCQAEFKLVATTLSEYPYLLWPELFQGNSWFFNMEVLNYGGTRIKISFASNTYKINTIFERHK
jgi:hypothetical protein